MAAGFAWPAVFLVQNRGLSPACKIRIAIGGIKDTVRGK
jgi:hypothetical protein